MKSKFCTVSGVWARFSTPFGALNTLSRKMAGGVLSTAIVAVAFVGSTAFGAGLNWDERDLEIWRERSESGPFKTAGDAYDARLPGEWQRIESEAASFKSDPKADRKTSIVMDSGPVGGAGIVSNHIDMLGAAFYALVEDDESLKRLVVSELVWHARQPGLQIAPDRYIKTDNGNWWQAGWLARLVVAADFVKDAFTAEERAEFEAWMRGWAQAYEYSVDFELSRWLFTHRKDRVYNRGGPYFSQTAPDAYAYMDASGKKHNMIDRAHKHYNNRKAGVMQFVGFYAAFSNDSMLIDRSKLYFEEWLKFSVFPDGSSGEFERNNDGGRNIQQGFLYNARNIEAYVTTADAFARLGDPSLFELTTRDGIHGTASASGQPDKDLRLVVKTYFDLMHHKKAWYNADRSVDERYRIDHVADIDGANKAGTQWVNEIWFAPIANRYWNDAEILAGYTRSAADSVPYAKVLGSAGPFGAPWRGHQAVYPSLPFMFAETEAIVVSDGGDLKPPVVTEPEPTPTPKPEPTPEPGPITEPSSGDYDLVYTTVYDSPNYSALDGVAIEQPVYVAVKPDSSILRVDYFIKDSKGETLVNFEKGAPFDYIYANRALTPEQIGQTGHTIIAMVTEKDGDIVRLEATAFPPAGSFGEQAADRLPDEWEMQYFGGLDVRNGGENEDFDGDLVSNYDEWLAGTDPTNAADRLSIEPVLGVTWKSRQDRSYRIEYSDDNWRSSEVSEVLVGNGGQMVWVDSSARDVRHNRQYRITVVNN